MYDLLCIEHYSRHISWPGLFNYASLDYVAKYNLCVLNLSNQQMCVLLRGRILPRSLRVIHRLLLPLEAHQLIRVLELRSEVQRVRAPVCRDLQHAPRVQ